MLSQLKTVLLLPLVGLAAAGPVAVPASEMTIQYYTDGNCTGSPAYNLEIYNAGGNGAAVGGEACNNFHSNAYSSLDIACHEKTCTCYFWSSPNCADAGLIASPGTCVSNDPNVSGWTWESVVCFYTS